jgi:hypothetical protein
MSAAGSSVQPCRGASSASGIWNVFARLGLPVTALMIMTTVSRTAGWPASWRRCGRGAVVQAIPCQVAASGGGCGERGKCLLEVEILSGM